MPRLGPQGLETQGKGSNGTGPGQGAGAWKPKEPPAQVSPCWCPWQVGHGRCTPVDVPQLVCVLTGVPQPVAPNRCDRVSPGGASGASRWARGASG